MEQHEVPASVSTLEKAIFPRTGSFETALHIAAHVHANQVDKAGAPYLHHVLRVGYSALLFGNDPGIVGILHDVLEDTQAVTTDHLLYCGFTTDHILALQHLRRPPDQRLEDAVTELLTLDLFERHNVIALQVKLCDTRDNANIARFENPTTHQKRRCEYYWQQSQRLLLHLRHHGLVG